jgi:hypothetical protein
MLFIALGLMAFIVVLMRFEPKRRKPMPADKAARLFEVKAWAPPAPCLPSSASTASSPARASPPRSRPASAGWWSAPTPG